MPTDLYCQTSTKQLFEQTAAQLVEQDVSESGAVWIKAPHMHKGHVISTQGHGYG
jgi:hypothetical protein